MLRIGHSLVAFKSKMAPSVALSTCEAEYVAACAGAQEAVFFRALLKDLGFEQKKATVMYEDNQSCIAHARNNDNHSRMKHIDVKKYFLRELVQDNVIAEYVSTVNGHIMMADMLTKPLGEKLHAKLRAMSGVVPM